MTRFPHFFILPLVLISSLTPTSHSNCIQNCGSTSVPYPFGFSAGCKIPLTCSNSGVPRIGEFPVRNVTFDRIILDVPPSCLRPLRSASPLFGRNYAPTRRNGLFLRGCNSSSSAIGCSIPTELISDRLNLLLRCGGSRNDNVSCYTRAPEGEEGGRGDFLARDGILATGCESLFTVVNYEAEGNLTALVFSTVEAGWWLDGGCSCSAGASCTRVVSPVTGGAGHRCRCGEGYEGDGYADGRGCVRGQFRNFLRIS